MTADRFSGPDKAIGRVWVCVGTTTSVYYRSMPSILDIWSASSNSVDGRRRCRSD